MTAFLQNKGVELGLVDMSTVFLHVGQCGNQLGQSFWQEVGEWCSPPGVRSLPSTTLKLPYKSGSHKTPSWSSPTHSCTPVAYSLLDGTLPCVLVDSETKVVRKYTGDRMLLGRKVPVEFRVTERGGRGNNWAYGYSSARVENQRVVRETKFGQDENNMVGRVQQCVRKLVEKCDRFGGFIQLHSIAGGTGSGVGSAIVEQLRDDYPLSYILSIAVAPFSRGETPLQHYNSLFCLHRLQTHTDGVILFQNDHILTQALKSVSGALKTMASPSGGISVEDMNGYISNTLCNVLLPIWSPNYKGPPAVSGGEPWELIRSVCPNPQMKFVLPSHCQFTSSTQSWDNAFSVITSAYRTAISPCSSTETGTSVALTPRPLTSALVCICRGRPSIMTSLVSNTSNIEKRLKQTYNTVSWNPFPIDFWQSHEPHIGDKKLVGVLANSAAVTDYLKSTVARARLMYHARAYLHWFERYRCEQGMFEEAFETVETVTENYSAL